MNNARFCLLTLGLFAAVVATFLSGCRKDYYLRGEYDKLHFIAECRWKHPVRHYYEPKQPYWNDLKAVSDSFDVKIFAGTWCSQSEKWMPRFFRMEPELAVRDLKIISIDESKLDSAGLAAKHKIEFVPTFIFFRDGKEIGRIVEKPDKRNLEKHVLEIVGKE